MAELLSEVSPCLGWVGFQTKRKKHNQDTFQNSCSLWPLPSKESEEVLKLYALLRKQVKIQHGTPMFRVALFITAQTWMQPKRPSTNE